MQRWTLLRLVDGQIFHLARTEDDILIRIRYGRYELRCGSVGGEEDMSAYNANRKSEVEKETGQKEGNGIIHMGFCALGQIEP